MSDPIQSTSSSPSNASKPKKRFVGRKTGPSKLSSIAPHLAHQIPADVLEDVALNKAIDQLPSNYSFEIHKTIHHVRKNGARMVALQMPEGLQMFACSIADIIEQFTTASTVIMGDVTYGACCVDDYTAVALGCDMLVHYGHSCLVPIDSTAIKTLYIFVEIAIDSAHLSQTIRLNIPAERKLFLQRLVESQEELDKVNAGQPIVAGIARLQLEGPSQIEKDSSGDLGDTSSRRTRLALVSTIQFVAAIQNLKENLGEQIPTDAASLESGKDQPNSISRANGTWTGTYEATIPRSKPLSPGEILGCTAPRLTDVDALLYVGDGRFHLESIMIANPQVPAFRYDPYSKKLTRETYDHEEMRSVRSQAIASARKSIYGNGNDNPTWGVVLGTLGRQGSFKQLQAITQQLSTSRVPIPYVPILLSELSPAKLSLFSQHISIFVQTSCPRLSIDWGYAFPKPLLSPYETAVAVGAVRGWKGSEENGEGDYPMDFYAAGSMAAVARINGSV